MGTTWDAGFKTPDRKYLDFVFWLLTGMVYVRKPRRVLCGSQDTVTPAFFLVIFGVVSHGSADAFAAGTKTSGCDNQDTNIELLHSRFRVIKKNKLNYFAGQF